VTPPRGDALEKLVLAYRLIFDCALTATDRPGSTQLGGVDGYQARAGLRPAGPPGGCDPPRLLVGARDH
jgi:hypothetical protein